MRETLGTPDFGVWRKHDGPHTIRGEKSGDGFRRRHDNGVEIKPPDPLGLGESSESGADDTDFSPLKSTGVGDSKRSDICPDKVIS